MKTMKGAIIGFGFISSKGHLPAYMQRSDVEIIAIADICDARRKLAQKALPNARVYEDYKSLLENETSLDFIDVCTPPKFHHEISVAGLHRGLHVLCEKPLTIHASEAKDLAEVALREKRVIYPCHNYKHSPVAKTIKGIIESGKIGKVKAITLNTFRNTHAKGVTEWNTHWRRQNEYSGGGITMDHGSHSFYLMFDWLGSYPKNISAKSMQLANHQYDTEDTINATLEFPTGTAVCFLTWAAGVRKVIYTIQGESGAITVDDDQVELAVMEKTQAEDVAQGNVDWKIEKSIIKSNWMDASHVTWFNSLFDSFKSAIETNNFVSKDALESILCVELINKAYQSSKLEGRAVQISTDTLAHSRETYQQPIIGSPYANS